MVYWATSYYVSLCCRFFYADLRCVSYSLLYNFMLYLFSPFYADSLCIESLLLMQIYDVLDHLSLKMYGGLSHVSLCRFMAYWVTFSYSNL